MRTFAPETESSAASPDRLGEPSVQRARTALRLTGRGAADLMLVLAAMALALGLGAVTASLAPSAESAGGFALERLPVVVATGASREGWPRVRAHDRPQPPAVPVGRVGESTPAALAHVGSTGPSVSSLYPQNGVTLWDRIRVGSQRDRRAFLLGAAIQIHAPATAATPGPP